MYNFCFTGCTFCCSCYFICCVTSSVCLTISTAFSRVRSDINSSLLHSSLFHIPTINLFSFLQGHIFHSDHAGLGWMFLPFHQVSVASDKSEPFCELFLFGMKFLSDFAVSHHLPFIHEVEHLKCFRLHCPLHIWALLSTWIMWICLHDRHSSGFSKLKFSGGLNLAIVFFLKILLRPCQIKLLASTAYWTPVSLLTNRAHTSPNLRTPWYFLFLLLAAPSVIGHRNILFQCNWYLNTPHTASTILLSAWFFFIFMCGDSYQ